MKRYVKSSTNNTNTHKSIRRPVKAAKVYTDGFSSYEPWSGAKETWEALEKYDKLDAFEAILDEAYYNEGIGEGVINETDLNDLLWFEPGWVCEMVGLYYDDYSGEISDEPFEGEV